MDVLHAQIDAVRARLFNDSLGQDCDVFCDFVRRISEGFRFGLKETGEFFGILVPCFEGDPDIVRRRKDIIESCDFAVEGFLDPFHRLDLLRDPRVIRPNCLDVVEVIRYFNPFFQQTRMPEKAIAHDLHEIGFEGVIEIFVPRDHSIQNRSVLQTTELSITENKVKPKANRHTLRFLVVESVKNQLFSIRLCHMFSS